MKQTTQTVDAIGGMDFTGNIIPHTWYQHLTKTSSRKGKEFTKPYLEAIVILSDIVYWYRPKITRDESTGRIVAVERKFAADKLQRSYQQLADMFGFGKDQARNAVKYLEERGVVTLELRNIKTSNTVLSNVLYIEPVPEAIKALTHIGSRTDTISVSEPTYPPQANGEGVGKPAETYTENTTQATTEKKTPSGDFPLDKPEEIRYNEIQEYKQEDSFDTQFNCDNPKCDTLIIIASLPSTGAECPKCHRPVRVRNPLGKVIKKPSQKARAKESGSDAPVDRFDDKPLRGFCALTNIPITGLNVKEKVMWGQQIKKVADTLDASVEETYQAIKSIKDSDHGWKTFTSPYQPTFQDVLKIMIMRQKAEPQPKKKTRIRSGEVSTAIPSFVQPWHKE